MVRSTEYLWGNRKMEKVCETCKYELSDIYRYPCNSCKHNLISSSPDYDVTPVLWEAKESRVIDDPVNHPSHYTWGKIEVWDFIADQMLNYDRGCAVKYICRAGKKDPDTEIQDLEKAVAYITHEIKMLKEGEK